MGLDMYIIADTVDEVSEDAESYEAYCDRRLAQWRKHPNLHGYIVRTYAAGVDECQRIALDANQIEAILAASEADQLPTTTGFFFGASREEDKADTAEQLRRVLGWMREHPDTKVYYRASW